MGFCGVGGAGRKLDPCRFLGGVWGWVVGGWGGEVGGLGEEGGRGAGVGLCSGDGEEEEEEKKEGGMRRGWVGRV